MFNSNKPFGWIEIIFGGIPYGIVDKRLFVTKPRIIYAFTFTLVFTGNTAVSMYFNTNGYTIVTYFRVFRVAFGWTTFTINIIAMIYWKNHLWSAYNHVHIYDITAKFHENKHKRPSEIHFQICAIAVMVFWIIVGYLTSQDDVELPTVEQIGYTFLYGCYSVQIFNFSGWMLLLYRRFHHLTRVIRSNDRLEILESTAFSIQDIWWLHYNLFSAAKKINTAYSIQLLLWTFGLSFNILSRIDSLINFQYINLFVLSRDLMCTVGFFVNLLIIIGSCDLTSRQANKVNSRIFSPFFMPEKRSWIDQDDNRAIAYFHISKVQFTAIAGLIKIQLPLLLSIVGAITSYMVILHN